MEEAIDTLKAIFRYAKDDNYSSDEALDIITELLEVHFAHAGVNPEDEEE